MSNEEYETFQAIRVICAKDAALQQERLRRGERYNLLSILGLSTYELKHSAIIANLLDPQGSHGCGDAFLRAFFDVLSLPYPWAGDEQITSRREVYAGPVTASTGGRIDILVSGKGYGLIIENKIYAEDQSNQLLRYDAYGREHFARYDLIYLTLYGCEASQESASTQAGQSVKHRPISYADQVLAWLTQCARLAYDRPLVRESINQYIQTIKQLTYQDMSQDNINKIIKLCVDSPDVVATLSKHRDAIAEKIREKYIFAPLRDYAESRNWEISIKEEDYEDCEDCKNSYGPHIHFKPKGWAGSILVSADCGNKKANKGWWMNLWIGVDLKEEGAEKLQCLELSSANYPYGYEDLKVKDWYAAENFPKMKSEVANTIKKIIDKIAQELNLC